MKSDCSNQGFQRKDSVGTFGKMVRGKISLGYHIPIGPPKGIEVRDFNYFLDFSRFWILDAWKL